MSRTKSPLATYERITASNKYKPRKYAIKRITPHCVVGNLSIEATLGLSKFHDGQSASTSYAIGTDGRIGLGVEETNGPWTSSSYNNDNQAITTEIANNGGAPDYRMSDAAINSWLNLSVDICKHYGFKKVAYQEKPANVTPAGVEAWIKTWAPSDAMIVTLHQWFANTICPGPYFIRQIPWLVKEMNKRLSGQVPEAFVGEGSSPSPSTPPVPPTPPTTNEQPNINTSYVSYLVLLTASALNVRSGPGTNYDVVRTLMNDKNKYTIVEEASGTGATKWGKLKSGLGWISLDYTKKA